MASAVETPSYRQSMVAVPKSDLFLVRSASRLALWEFGALAPLFQWQGEHKIIGAAASPEGQEGRWVAMQDDYSNVWIYSAQTGEQLHRLPTPDNACDFFCAGTLAFSKDGRLLAVAKERLGVYLYEVQSGKLLAKFATDGDARSLAFSKFGDRLYLATTKAFTTVDVTTGEEMSRLHSHYPGQIAGLSADYRWILTLGYQVIAYDTQSPEKREFSVTNPEAAFSHAGHLLAFDDVTNKRIIVTRIKDWQDVAVIHYEQSDSLKGIFFSADDTRIRAVFPKSQCEWLL